MFAVLAFALVFLLLLALVLARYGGESRQPRARREPAADQRIGVERLHALADELLTAMGLTPIEVALPVDERRLLVRRDEPAREQRVVAFVEADPPGDLVEQTVVLELVEEVRGEGAAMGLLITPYEIAREGLGGLDLPVELVDGERLRELVATYLPSRLPELQRYRGFGRASAAPRLADYFAPPT